MQQVASAHQSLQGVPPTIAELQYIIEAQQLDGYGMEYYPAKVYIITIEIWTYWSFWWVMI